MLIGTLADVRKRRRGAPSLGYYAPDLPAGGGQSPFAILLNGQTITLNNQPITKAS